MSRVTVAFALLAACSFSPQHAGDGGPSDGPPENRVTVTDAGSAFTGAITGGLVTTRGTLEPDTYVTGGLHAVGYTDHGHLATQAADLTTIASMLGTPTGEDYGFVPFVTMPTTPGNGDVSHPRGLHQSASDDFAIVLDGEIYLADPSTTLQLDADDQAAFAITTPSAPTPQRIQAATGTSRISILAPTPGWYPIAGVFGEVNFGAHLKLAILDGNNNITTLLPDRLRAKTTTIPGLAFVGYAFAELLTTPFAGYEPASIGHDLAPDLTDLGLAAPDSARFTGQLLVDADGDYVATVTTGSGANEGFRLYLDGALVASDWLTVAPTVPRSAPTHLFAGWHSVAIDYAHASGSAVAAFALGPTPDALVPVPADHLRPTRPFGTAAIALGGPVVWGAATPTTLPLPISTAPAGAVIDAVDVAYNLTGPRNANAQLTLVAGSASVAVPIHATQNEGDKPAAPYDYIAADPTFVGMPLPEAWQATFVDPVGTDGGQLIVDAVITYHGGGPAPFSTPLVYTSPPRETPNAIALRRLHVDGAGGTLAGVTPVLSVRVAADAAGLDGASWQLVPDGDFDLEGPFGALQYRVQLAGDGWQFPAVVSVTFTYDIPLAAP